MLPRETYRRVTTWKTPCFSRATGSADHIIVTVRNGWSGSFEQLVAGAIPAPLTSRHRLSNIYAERLLTAASQMPDASIARTHSATCFQVAAFVRTAGTGEQRSRLNGDSATGNPADQRWSAGGRGRAPLAGRRPAYGGEKDDQGGKDRIDLGNVRQGHGRGPRLARQMADIPTNGPSAQPAAASGAHRRP